jgi:glycine dehydrogenase subunit 1
MRTYLKGAGIELVEIDFNKGITDIAALSKKISEQTACLIIQQPNFLGCLEEVFEMEKLIHKAGGLFVTSVDPVSLGILNAPSEYGADIVTGEGQSLGNHLNFGGPYLGIFAVKNNLIRYLPGRIVGATEDSKGKRGYVLTLQTREQHIRREKATSNICSNEALCALAACVYMKALGGEGLRKIAQTCVDRARYLKERISKIKGFSIAFEAPSFMEFAVKTESPVTAVNEKLLKEGIVGGLDLGKYYKGLDSHMLLCATEMNTEQDIDKLISVLKNV